MQNRLRRRRNIPGGRLRRRNDRIPFRRLYDGEVENIGPPLVGAFPEEEEEEEEEEEMETPVPFVRAPNSLLDAPGSLAPDLGVRRQRPMGVADLPWLERRFNNDPSLPIMPGADPRARTIPRLPRGFFPQPEYFYVGLEERQQQQRQQQQQEQQPQQQFDGIQPPPEWVPDENGFLLVPSGYFKVGDSTRLVGGLGDPPIDESELPPGAIIAPDGQVYVITGYYLAEDGLAYLFRPPEDDQGADQGGNIPMPSGYEPQPVDEDIYNATPTARPIRPDPTAPTAAGSAGASGGAPRGTRRVLTLEEVEAGILGTRQPREYQPPAASGPQVPEVLPPEDQPPEDQPSGFNPIPLSLDPVPLARFPSRDPNVTYEDDDDNMSVDQPAQADDDESMNEVPPDLLTEAVRPLQPRRRPSRSSSSFFAPIRSIRDAVRDSSLRFKIGSRRAADNTNTVRDAGRRPSGVRQAARDTRRK
ncbi:hypothetical protein GGR52DRAFT_64254 [Hypoxylon sp. FL1284]|nr:hypothetical protein GGR52DRAFT_64254 [Hypoxylon sp. FL1284]